jgi:valyl-tRNA synthetase
VFDDALRLLHPFMPFLTEELWHQLPQRAGAKSIALQEFATNRQKSGKVPRANEFVLIQDTIGEIRNIRAEMKLDPKKKIAAEFHSSYGYIRDTIERNREGIQRLAILSDLKVSAAKLSETGGTVRSTARFDVRIVHSTDAVDAHAEKARLRKEIEGLEKSIGSKENQLGNTTFRSKAPPKIISGMEATMAEQRLELEKLHARLRDVSRIA